MPEINTKQFVQHWKDRLKIEVNAMKRKPKLNIIVAKDFSEPSKTYIRNKIKVAEEIGIETELIELEWVDKTKQQLTDELIEEFIIAKVDNASVIVQAPFPQFSENEIGELLNPYYEYDVDGFSPIQKGLLVSGDNKALVPATALGIIELLKWLYDDLTGKTIDIVTRSGLIGKPLTSLALKYDMTPRIIHSKSNIDFFSGDIIVTGCGKRKIFNSKDIFYLTETIIDCSMHHDKKYPGVGDWDKEELLREANVSIASGYGHTGICTTVALMHTVIKAHKLREEII